MNNHTITFVGKNRLFDIVAETIKESGYRITTVSNALLALDYLKSEKHSDLYITDLILDDMDGLSLIEEMQAIEPGTEIIALMANSETIRGGLDLKDDAIRKMALESGAHSVFVAPFNLGELVETIHRISEAKTC